MRGAENQFVERPNGPGTGLFSQGLMTRVSSALERFTTVFGKGTGGTTPLSPPGPLGRPTSWRFRFFPFSDSPPTPSRQARRSARECSEGNKCVEQGKKEEGGHGSCRLGEARDRDASPRPLVTLSSTHYCASTCVLSTSWSRRGLTRLTRWGISSSGELRT